MDGPRLLVHLIEKGVGPVQAGHCPVLVANYVLRSVVFCSNRLILSMDDNDLWCQLESLEDGECEPDCSCAGCLLASTTHDNPPPPPDKLDEPHPPLQLKQTCHKKAALLLKASVEGQDNLSKVLHIIDTINKQEMTLSLFLDALSWGDESCTANDHVRYAHTGLLVSEELLNILVCWYKPPHNKNKGPCSAGAHQAMQTFAIYCVLQQLDREMECAAFLFSSPPSQLSETHPTSFDFNAFTLRLRTQCPMAWRVVEWMSYSNSQRPRNTHKSPDMI